MGCVREKVCACAGWGTLHSYFKTTLHRLLQAVCRLCNSETTLFPFLSLSLSTRKPMYVSVLKNDVSAFSIHHSQICLYKLTITQLNITLCFKFLLSYTELNIL